MLLSRVSRKTGCGALKQPFLCSAPMRGTCTRYEMSYPGRCRAPNTIHVYTSFCYDNSYAEWPSWEKVFGTVILCKLSKPFLCTLYSVSVCFSLYSNGLIKLVKYKLGFFFLENAVRCERANASPPPYSRS